MLVSFTQTYSNRPELIDVYFKDKRMMEFKSKFDLNIYAFHNCPDSVIEKFKKLNTIENTKILIYNKISYTETVRQTLEYLNSINCDHLYFAQDDTFSFDNDVVDFDELLKYVTSNKESFMLNLHDYYRGEHDEKQIIKFDSFNVYPSNTVDHGHFFFWALDDATYIASMDVVNEIYDNFYFTLKDIWTAEMYLRDKYTVKKLNRYVTDKMLFQNYNILGKTIYSKKKYIAQLKDKNFM